MAASLAEPGRGALHDGGRHGGSFPHHIGLVLDYPNDDRCARRAIRSEAVGAITALIDTAVRAGTDYVTVWAADDVTLGDELADIESEIATIRPDVHTRLVLAPCGPPPPSSPASRRPVITFVGPHDGRQDFAEALSRWLDEVAGGFENPGELQCGLDLHEILAFSRCAGLPPVDLVIRSAGAWPICSALLLLTAYAEHHSLPGHWHEIEPADAERAWIEFAGRKRRFGL